MSNTAKDINKRDRMKNVTLDERGEIKVTASATSSKNDFDFLQGRFTVHHKILKSRLNNSNEWFEFDGSMEMRIVLMGIGNVENHYMTTVDEKLVEGFALRLFDPITRLWSIYWASSQTGVLDIPVVGSFDGNKGYFFANDHFNGKEILLHFEWDIMNPSQPLWKQAFSVDEGNTWEWNWYMYFTKTESIEEDAADMINVLEGKDQMADLVTTENSQIIHLDDRSPTFPAEKTFHNPKPKLLSLSFKKTGELEIQPSSTSSRHDYDFLTSNHKVHHKKLKSRLSGSNEWIEFDGTKETISILRGIGNVELHYMNMPNSSTKEGMALRLFNPVTRLWSLYWADSDFGILDKPQVGSFENNIGIFLARDMFYDREIIVQFQYDKTDPDKLTWGQAFSPDGGKTWEWNWFMFYEK